MPKRKHMINPQQLWENISSHLVHFVEETFFSLGLIVARYPWRTILITWVFVLLSCIGLLKLHIEKNPMKLWVPPESDYYYDTNWYIDKFGTGFRIQKLIITADNVLDPNVLMLVYNITNEIESIQVSYEDNQYNIEKLCYKVPIVSLFSRKTRSVENVNIDNNNAVHSANKTNSASLFSLLTDDLYCSVLKSFEMTCLKYNILDLWNNNADLIANTTKRDIVKKVNKARINPITGHPADYTKLLGGVHYDDNGEIVSAKSVLLLWYTYVNMSDVDLNEVGNLVGTEDWVSMPVALWENKFIDIMANLSQNTIGVNHYYEAGRSFGDISGQAMFNDLDKLFLGIFFMFLYIQFALSSCNWLQIRLTLGSVGLLCVGMAYATSVSWCSLLGVEFGPVHSSLPFLLMGLGVDDMFVMNACWKNLCIEDSTRSIPVKVALMLKHAGVSIVITSFTDIVALLIGAITILPSLKSFCIYAAVGVFFIFCYSVTFFVAVFTLDIKRIEAKRNGVLFCYQHKNDIQVSKKETIFQKIVCKFYKKIVFTIPGKSIVIILTIIMTSFSIVAIFRLEQRFDPKWFVPDGTYYKQFLDTHEHYYPDEGYTAMVFLGEMNYNKEFKTLHAMVEQLKNQSYVTDVVSWIESFHKYVDINFDHDLLNSSMISDHEFNYYLSQFLFSSSGGRFQINFKFSDPLTCGVPVKNITASTMSFKLAKFEGPEEYIPAMNQVKNLVKSTNTSTGDGYSSVWSKVFANWVTDEVISVEVERNIELALICVMGCTIVLITNLQMCLWIFICVLLTILNVLGWMQRWGMTVDIVCCIGLELAIGLCVDYAAHVGHTFLTMTNGNRQERAFKTVTTIGSAVLLGGGSTFLSLSLLSMSKAYTFQSFFKIFLLVIIFGLFNGLIFLPVVLSLIGPAPYKPKIQKDRVNETEELNGKQLVEIPDKEIDDSC